MSWTDWTSGDWLGKWMPQWTPPTTRVPDAITEKMSRLIDVFGFSPAGFLNNVVSTAAVSLVGRQLETRIGGEEVRFVLDALRVEPTRYGPLVGQFGVVEAEVHDARWRDRRVARLRVRAGNVHIQPEVPTMLVAAPVELSATLDQAEVASLVSKARPGVVVTLADGIATAAMEGRERWGHIEIAPELRGDTVRLQPVALVVRGRRLHSLARLIPGVEFRLPAAPHNGRFDRVVVEGGRLLIDAVVDEWREPLQPTQLQDLERRLRRSGGGLFLLQRAPAS